MYFIDVWSYPEMHFLPIFSPVQGASYTPSSSCAIMMETEALVAVLLDEGRLGTTFATL